MHAVTSTEDKHFFSHSGFDLLRILKAAYVDVKDGRKAQGASTLTMQLARGFWLDPRQELAAQTGRTADHACTWSSGSPSSRSSNTTPTRCTSAGAERSASTDSERRRAFTSGRTSRKSPLPEAALLAGMVQRPSYYNPQRYPDRARERRDLVLHLMRQNGYLDEQQYRQALAAPVTVSPEQYESIDHQYFVDLMNEEAADPLRRSARSTRGYIYTTLDPDLQQAAEAVRRAWECSWWTRSC